MNQFMETAYSGSSATVGSMGLVYLPTFGQYIW